MNKQFFKYILFLLLTYRAVNAGAQNIQAEAKLQQYTIRIGDQTKLFLSVHQPVKEHVNFPKLTDTITGKVQVVSVSKPDTAFDSADHKLATITQAYLITSFDAGTYTIPSFAFGTSGGVLKSSELTLQVTSVKVDTTKGIYDIKQPLKVSYTIFDWLRDNWLWVLIPILVVLLVIGLIYYYRKRPKKEVVVKVIAPVVPAHHTALNQLKALRDKKLWQQGEVKQYYIELSDVIREYLEKRYVIKTHEKTTDEIIIALRHIDITTDNKNILHQLLTMSDLVKFAKEKPFPVENEQNLDNAISFVTNTKERDISINPEGGDADV